METIRRYCMLLDGGWVDTDDRFDIRSPRGNDWHVTALPPEGSRFSGHFGLTRAQPGPGVDVPGPVDVGIVQAAAGQITVSCRAQLLREAAQI
jgi:hypothetical protein